MTDKGYNILHTLPTTAMSNSGKTYNVHIVQGKQLSNDTMFKGLVLSIEDTPASWYVETLFSDEYGSPAIGFKEISIHGRDWLCVNWQDIVVDMKAWLLSNKYIY